MVNAANHVEINHIVYKTEFNSALSFYLTGRFQNNKFHKRQSTNKPSL